MIKLNQKIINRDNGDCTRACVASIFELPIDAVPNFIRFGANWFPLFHAYLRFCGYEYIGSGYPLSDKYPRGDKLEDSPNVKGYVIASVPSKNYKKIGHSVVMNLKGKIVHDPNPKKQWQNINALKTGELNSWMMISRMADQ